MQFPQVLDPSKIGLFESRIILLACI